MIPADHWHDNGDGTAWWVNDAPGAANMTTLDRPCDEPACSDGWWYDKDDDPQCRCEQCGGTGRHTFDVEVAVEHTGTGWITDRHRVSVVPDTVLPITSGVIASDCVDHLGNVWEYGYARDCEPEWRLIGHAPPAARPDMTAVKLAIQ